MNFSYESLSTRVLFGAGKFAELPAEITRLNMQRPLIISTRGQYLLATQARSIIGADTPIFAGAVAHVPSESVTEILTHINNNQNDGCICIGGSSTIGLAKAVALQIGLPILAVPTTYAGSEMTPIWGITEAGVKVTGRNPIVQPKTVIYDPLLTLTLPPLISGPSGINALAHCVEALYAENQNPIISMMSETSIKALAESLPVLCKYPLDESARTKALYGSWLAGIALGSVGMALHHKLCHVLGGSFSLPHAQVHSVMLSHVVNYNKRHAPAAMEAIARALSVDVKDVAGGIFDLAQQVGAPLSLAAIGMNEADLVKATEHVLAKPYYNPRAVTGPPILELLQNAYRGVRPIA